LGCDRFHTQTLLVMAVLVLVCVISCRKRQSPTAPLPPPTAVGTPEAEKTAEPVQKSERKEYRAVALSGCVIVEQKGSRLRYVKKCESCGHLPPGTVGTNIPSKGAKLTSSFRCPKCGKTQKIVIQGTE